MHFPIIELTSEKLDAGDWMNEFSFIDDATALYYTDYTQEITEGERRHIIRVVLPVFFFGIADVDVEKEEVKFKSVKEIEKVLDSYLQDVVEKIEAERYALNKSASAKFYDLRCLGRKYKDSEMLIHFDGGTYTSMQFIEDACYHAGKTLYIGGILDAHM